MHSYLFTPLSYSPRMNSNKGNHCKGVSCMHSYSFTSLVSSVSSSPQLFTHHCPSFSSIHCLQCHFFHIHLLLFFSFFIPVSYLFVSVFTFCYSSSSIPISCLLITFSYSSLRLPLHPYSSLFPSPPFQSSSSSLFITVSFSPFPVFFSFILIHHFPYLRFQSSPSSLFITLLPSLSSLLLLRPFFITASLPSLPFLSADHRVGTIVSVWSVCISLSLSCINKRAYKTDES